MSILSDPITPWQTIRNVIDGGYCIGCGLCSHLSNGAIPNRMNRIGIFQPILPSPEHLSEQKWQQIEYVCPFTDKGPDESEIAAQLYSDLPADEVIGRHRQLYIGHQTDQNRRIKASSGGIISWILCQLIESEKVDFVIHVKPGDNNTSQLFEYSISKTVNDILEGAGSRYYPIEMSRVLSIAHELPGTCAIVGLPCFIKGMRRLMHTDPKCTEKVRFLIGLVCGHLKSAAFVDSLAWQIGISPGRLDKANFRVKFPDRPADDYGFSGTTGDQTVTRPTRELFAGNWGYNLFRYPACDHCDDVFAECADMTVGDAWLPEYTKDSMGNSVVVVRNKELAELLSYGTDVAALNLKEATVAELQASQSGGIRDRREGLKYRQWLKQQAGIWAPRKRFEPDASHLNLSRRGLYRSRVELMRCSHAAWLKAVEEGRYEVFIEQITPFLVAHHDWYHTPWTRIIIRTIRKIKPFIPSVLIKAWKNARYLISK
jgi:coenzyme F420 hydrogenase subunit beta